MVATVAVRIRDRCLDSTRRTRYSCLVPKNTKRNRPSQQINETGKPNGPNHLTHFLGEIIATVPYRDRLKQHLRSSLYRNSYYLIAANAANAVLGLLFWIMGARFYSAEDVGLSSAAINIATLLAMLSTLGLDYGLIRFLPGSGEGGKAAIDSSLTVGGAVSTVITLFFVAGVGIWSPALVSLRENPVSLCAFVAVTIAGTLDLLVRSTFTASRRSGFALAQVIANNLLRLTLVGLFASFYPTAGILTSCAVALAAALVISTLLFLPRVQADYRPRFAVKLLTKGSSEREQLKKMMHFSSANYAAAILLYAPWLVLPAMVANRLGGEANAYFYISWGIASILFFIPLSVSFSLFAEGSHNEGQFSQDTNRSIKVVLLLLVPAIVLMLLVGNRLLLLFGQDYSEQGTGLLRILTVSALPLSLNYVYFGVKRVEMKMKGVIGLTAFTAVATLGLSYILLPRMGIEGAGVAWLASQGAASIVIMKDFRVSFRVRPKQL